LVSQILSQALPPINGILAKSPIVIPNVLFGLFELTDVKIAYHDDYIAAGLTPHFYPVTQNKSKIDSMYSIFTKPGTYRYTQTLDISRLFTMWDNKMNQRVEDVKSLKEIE